MTKEELIGVLEQFYTKEKQEQYACDILYTTNNEVGFDYLRDNMAFMLRLRQYCTVIMTVQMRFRKLL